MIDYEEFEKVDIRSGVVIQVTDFPEGKYSTHIVKIDFGSEIGVKTSLARLSPNYGSDIVNKQIIGVVNLKPKQIGKYMSEALILGLKDDKGNLVLVGPDSEVSLGERLY